jgi:very-short-patch-repair endonuclease
VEADDLLYELASQQHRLVSVRQVYQLGLSYEQLRDRITRGEWERVTSRVLARTGAPITDLALPMLAVLHHGADTYVSHTTALGAWGVPGFRLRPTNVMSRRVRDRRGRVAVIHSTTDLTDAHITVLQGVPIVTPIRAIFDIAGREHPRKVERALDNAWARRLVSYALLHRTIDELGRRGRPGIALMREIARARPSDYRPPESNTEARVNEILERAGRRPLRRQVNKGSQTNWIGRIDLVDEELPLIVEVQSELFHGSVLDQRRDDERIAALRAAGHEVVEVWETNVWRDAAGVVRDIEEGRSRARAGRAGRADRAA